VTRIRTLIDSRVGSYIPLCRTSARAGQGARSGSVPQQPLTLSRPPRSPSPTGNDAPLPTASPSVSSHLLSPIGPQEGSCDSFCLSSALVVQSSAHLSRYNPRSTERRAALLICRQRLLHRAIPARPACCWLHCCRRSLSARAVGVF